MKRSIRNVLTVICAILVFALFIPAVTGIVNNAKANCRSNLILDRQKQV